MSALTGLITLDRQSAARPPAPGSSATTVDAPLNFSLLLLTGAPPPPLQPAGTGAQTDLEREHNVVQPGAVKGQALNVNELLLPLHPAGAGGNLLPLSGEELPLASDAAVELTDTGVLMDSAWLIHEPVAEPASDPALLSQVGSDVDAPAVSVSAIPLDGVAPTSEEIGINIDSAPAVVATTGLAAGLREMAEPHLQSPLSAAVIIPGVDAATQTPGAASAADITAATSASANSVTPLDAARAVLLQDSLKSNGAPTPGADARGMDARPAAPISLLNETLSLESSERLRHWHAAVTASAAPLDATAVSLRPTGVTPGQLQVFAEQLQSAMQPAADTAAPVPAPAASASAEELPGTPLRQEPNAAPGQQRTPPAAAFNPHTFSQTLGHGIDEPQWGESFARHISLLTGQKVSSAEVQLDPPELGSLLVRINITGDQASISFVSPHLQVRDSIEQSFDRLQNMLGEQGLDLVDVNVSDQSFQERGGQQEHQSSGPETDTPPEPEHALTVRHVGLVDYYI